MALLTIGHSTHSLAVFLELLHLHRVNLLADVRSIPHSRRHPHFSRDALEGELAAHRIGYRHFAALGGKRVQSYAGHMATRQFRDALDQLLRSASSSTVAAMCAEADPLQCHRQYLADAVVARGVDVIHLLPGGAFRYRTLSPLARVSPEGLVTYPTLLDAGE